MHKNKKSVFFVHPEGNHFNNPTLYEIEKLLHRNGVDSYFFPGDINYGEKKIGIIYKILFKIVSNIYYRVPHFLLKTAILLLFSRNTNKICNSDLIVGIDHLGIIEASIISKAFRKPFVFFSFEIMFADEIGSKKKQIEIEASRDIKAILVQDKARAALITTENKINIEPTLVPVANSGLPSATSIRLRDELGIPLEKKVAILIGSIAEWTCAPGLIKEFCTFPSSEWCLIVHDRYGSIPDWLCDLLGTNAEILYFSSTPRDFNAMNFVLSGVDVGLAFYKNQPGNHFLGKNISNIGLSSGKISTYLRHEIPVITNISGELADMIKTYGAGHVVENEKDVYKVMEEIKPNMKLAARQLFLDVFDFIRYEEKVLNILPPSHQ